MSIQNGHLKQEKSNHHPLRINLLLLAVVFAILNLKNDIRIHSAQVLGPIIYLCFLLSLGNIVASLVMSRRTQQSIQVAQTYVRSAVITLIIGIFSIVYIVFF